GYAPYVEACADLLQPHHEVVRSPIGEEVVRAKQALAEAAGGREVALVCSGDPGVYAMASIALELAADAPGVAIETVPGVTAALAASAAAGAPLGHDFATISLSDLLTPWEAIEARLRAAAAADFALALYNPRSERRTWQLDAARQILLEHRAPTTPVAVVTDATRSDEHVQVTTLAELDPAGAGMTTCVDAVDAGVCALRAGAPVLCDVEMVRSGIRGVTTECFLADAPAAELRGETRAALGMRAAAFAHPTGAVVVVGCAPTALDEVLDL